MKLLIHRVRGDNRGQWVPASVGQETAQRLLQSGRAKEIAGQQTKKKKGEPKPKSKEAIRQAEMVAAVRQGYRAEKTALKKQGRSNVAKLKEDFKQQIQAGKIDKQKAREVLLALKKRSMAIHVALKTKKFDPVTKQLLETQVKQIKEIFQQ